MEDNCFTILYWPLPHNDMNQPRACVCPLPLEPSPSPHSISALYAVTEHCVSSLCYAANSCSAQFSRSAVSDSLRPHESQRARPPCPSPTPRVHSDPRPSSGWCHAAISSSVAPFSSCSQSPPAAGSFPVSHLFYMCSNMFQCCPLNRSHLLLPILCPKSVLYVCVSILALQTVSSVPLF